MIRRLIAKLRGWRRDDTPPATTHRNPAYDTPLIGDDDEHVQWLCGLRDDNDPPDATDAPDDNPQEGSNMSTVTDGRLIASYTVRTRAEHVRRLARRAALIVATHGAVAGIAAVIF